MAEVLVVSNSRLIVNISDKHSDSIKLIQGVLQGSTLGPTLFSTLWSSIKNGKNVQYADDTIVCFIGKSKTDLEPKATEDLKNPVQHIN